MAGCLQKIPSGNESRTEGENDEMGIPKYRERLRLKDLYNPDEESIYLHYVDADNLYGWAMIQKLSTHGFLLKKAEDIIPEKIDNLVKKRHEKSM